MVGQRSDRGPTAYRQTSDRRPTDVRQSDSPTVPTELRQSDIGRINCPKCSDSPDRVRQRLRQTPTTVLRQSLRQTSDRLRQTSDSSDSSDNPGSGKLGRNGLRSDIPRECVDPPENLRDLRDLPTRHKA